MFRIKIFLLLLTYVHFCPYVDASFNATDVYLGNLTYLEEDLLKHLCYEVDICDADAETADVMPNGDLDGYRVSCCKGCSCHPSCKEKFNCCYPNKTETDPRTEEFISSYECLYSAIVRPGEEVPHETPAFQTKVKAPADGCLVDKPLKILPELSVQPSCDETSYFPVYSETENEIYKNIQCAHCHGAKDPRFFAPYLFCGNLGRSFVPLFEQFRFFETGQLSPRCRIEFKLDNQDVISSKRCYLNVIDTCERNTLFLPDGLIAPYLNIKIIQNLCESSVYSPFTSTWKYYRNVFCAMCGVSSRSSLNLKCQKDLTDRFEVGGFTHLIDQKILLDKIDQVEKQNYPEACLYDNDEKIQESCRNIYCPTGRTINSQGECAFISKFWQSPAKYLIEVKLSPMRGQDFRTKFIEMGSDALQAALLDGLPWPTEWDFWTVYVRSDSSICDENANIIVRMLAEASNPASLIEQIEQTVKVHWPLVIEGKRFEFEQSLVEYVLKVPFDSFAIPTASHYQDGLKVFGCDEIKFERSILVYSSPPVVITKLILCRQVQLKPNEFTLGPRNTYVSSNLTRRMLFGKEFELVTTEFGTEARICLADTFFALSGINKGEVDLPGPFIVHIAMIQSAIYIVFYS